MEKSNKILRGLRKNALTLSAALVLSSFFSCSNGDDPIEPSDLSVSRTVVVYMVAENTLNNAAPADVSEIIKGAKSLTDNDCIILFIDDIKNPRIYKIDNKTQAENLVSLVPEMEYESDVLSTSPQVLAQVLDYAREHHPADCYGIVFWSHASGWQMLDKEVQHSVNTRNENNVPSRRYSFGIDNGMNSSSTDFIANQEANVMSVIDLADVVEQKMGKVEFILFDCCFMQTVEVAYQLRNATHYIIGSPAEIPFNGAPYQHIVPLFADKLDCNAIVDAYYDYYKNNYGIQLSLIDTDGIDAFTRATKSFWDKYRASMEAIAFDKVDNYFNYDNCRHNKDNCYPDFYDVNSLMSVWLSEADYKAWKSSLDKFVVSTRATSKFYSCFPNNNSTVDPDNVACVSMFLPLQKYRGDYFVNSYFQLDWSKEMGIY